MILFQQSVRISCLCVHQEYAVRVCLNIKNVHRQLHTPTLYGPTYRVHYTLHSTTLSLQIYCLFESIKCTPHGVNFRSISPVYAHTHTHCVVGAFAIAPLRERMCVCMRLNRVGIVKTRTNNQERCVIRDTEKGRDKVCVADRQRTRERREEMGIIYLAREKKREYLSTRMAKRTNKIIATRNGDDWWQYQAKIPS